MFPFREINIPKLIYQINRPNYMVNNEYRLNNFYKLLLCLLYPFILLWNEYNTKRQRAYKIAACQYGKQQVIDILNDLYDPDGRHIEAINVTSNKVYLYPSDYEAGEKVYWSDKDYTAGGRSYLYTSSLTTGVIINYPSYLEENKDTFSEFTQTVDSLIIWGTKYKLKSVQYAQRHNIIIYKR